MRSWRLDALDRVWRFSSARYSSVGAPGLASWTASSAHHRQSGKHQDGQQEAGAVDLSRGRRTPDSIRGSLIIRAGGQATRDAD
jgi:hypothetical protein